MLAGERHGGQGQGVDEGGRAGAGVRLSAMATRVEHDAVYRHTRIFPRHWESSAVLPAHCGPPCIVDSAPGEQGMWSRKAARTEEERQCGFAEGVQEQKVERVNAVE